MKIASPLSTEPLPILQWIEVAGSLQIPSFHIVGLASLEVTEARERVRAAIEASDFEFPRRRIVVNLSPASIRKRGTGSDLAIALAILDAASEGALPESIVASGELGLDGRVKSVGQVMRTLYASWRSRAKWILLGPEDYRLAYSYLEALNASGIFDCEPPRLLQAADLRSAWQVLLQPTPPEPPMPPMPEESQLEKNDDGSELLPLNPNIERMLATAVSGRHHFLMLGPRGAGKSHALDWFAKLQPMADLKTRIDYQLTRELSHLPSSRLESRLPIRRVGAQVKPAALVGSATATALKPGEFSLAHGGALLADEFLEWSRDSREAFREPLERGKITLTRTHASVELPAAFTLAANGNLCPCGGWPKSLPGHARAPCTCTPVAVKFYLERLSGPILDRMDIVALIPSTFTGAKPKGRALSELRNRVETARALANSLWGKPAGNISSAELEALLKSSAEWRRTMERIELSSLRSRHKVLRVGISLAIWDYLEGRLSSPHPRPQHFEEASYFRPETLNLLRVREDPQAT